MYKDISYIFLVFLILSTCSKTPATDTGVVIPESSDQGWLVPFSEIVDNGGGKESIRSINNPTFSEISSSENGYLKDSDLIIGSIANGTAKAYPHRILNFHEIVNDTKVTINYCPLTGTSFGWNNDESLFGVSGLLYENNLILYDHETDSNWSQLLLKCINGQLIKNEPTIETIIETNWKTWKTLYPNSLVLKGKVEQTSNNNDTSVGKERVYTIINKDEKSKIYNFDTFTNGKVIKDLFNNKTYLVIGNENLIVSFELNAAQKNLEFNYSFNNTTSFFSDNEGNKWSVFGLALSGPRKGDVLKTTISVVGFRIAIDDFYPNALTYTY